MTSPTPTILAWPAHLLRFGTVGAIAYLVDVALFNLLRFGPGELLGARPVTAKVVSVAVATLVAWLGNRYWVFATSRRSSRSAELVAFGLVNLGGMVIAAGCLAVSHYALGLTSPLADNLAANGVGLVLGTAFRYVAYRWLVFTGDGPSARAEGARPERAGITGDGAAAPRRPGHQVGARRPGRADAAPHSGPGRKPQVDAVRG